MKEPGFFLRIGLALSTFVKVLFNGRYAAQVISIGDAEVGGVDEHSHDTVPMDSLTTAAAVPDVEPPPPIDENALNRKALQFIGALQREGRFIDFLMDEIDGAQDADIGAAARVIHAGCKGVLNQYLTVEPVWPGEEGSQVTVDEGFDAHKISLTGNVVGAPPFSGRLEHRGWHATAIRLPALSDSHDPSILAPAEIEL